MARNFLFIMNPQVQFCCLFIGYNWCVHVTVECVTTREQRESKDWLSCELLCIYVLNLLPIFNTHILL